jgi:hypothetical protein
VLAVVCSVALGILSQAPTLEEVGAFADGMKMYDRFEFEKASFAFRAATRAPGLGRADVARAQLWLGLALAQAGDELSAREAFVEAVRADGATALPADAPPTLQPLFQDARAYALSSPQAETSADRPKLPPVGAPSASRRMSRSVIVGGVLAGAGAVLTASGGVVGLVALGQADEARKRRFQDDADVRFREAETTAALGSTLVGLGAVALTVGAGVAVFGRLVEE